MQKFAVKHLRIAILLNLVIILVLGIYIFTNFFPKNDEKDKPIIAPPHNEYRAARPSLNLNLQFETNIGGSGNDTALVTFNHLGKYHVFGTTDSTDYDFQSEQSDIFFMTLSANGTIEKKVLYSSPTADKLESVTIAYNGYIIVYSNDLNNGDLVVMTIDYNGKVLTSKNFSSVSKITFCEMLLLTDRNYCLVYSIKSAPALSNELRAVKLSDTLDKLSETAITYGALLEYVEMHELGDEMRLLANVVFDKVRYVCIVSFDYKSNPTYTLMTQPQFYRTLAVIPYKSGFIALIVDTDTTARGSLLIIQGNTVARRIDLKIGSVNHGKLLFADGNYYVFASYGTGQSCVKMFDNSITEQASFPQLTSISDITDSRVTNDGIIICGTTLSGTVASGTVTSRIFVALINGKNMYSLNTFGGSGEESAPIITLSSGGLLVTSSSTSSDFDVGGNFGGRDVWLLFMRM